MELKVWLPLNKDLRSVGLSKVTAINSGATLDNNGIIGKCYNISLGKYIGLDAKNVNNHKYSPISIALWVYPTQNDSTSRSVFGCWENGGGGFYFKSRKMGFNFYIGGAYHSCEMPSTLSLNTWHHICGTYDEKVMRLYIDGVEVATTSVSGKITYHSTCPWEIGGNPGATAFAAGNFAGKFNDIRIYDNCISESDVKRIYQQKLFELVPYSDAKDVLFDRSGFMNMPLVNNGAIFQNNALYFNGSAKLRPKNGNVGLTMDDGTLSVWFTIETASTTYQIIYIDSVSKLAIGYVKGSNAFITTCNGTGSKTCFKATDVKFDGSINNVIVSYNTGKTPQFLLVNGVQAVTTTADVWTESSGLTIGSRMYNTTQSGFKGKLLKVGVYNRQFTQDEAVELYNSERGMFLPDDYIQLEYIQSNGTQYIDTGINGFNSGDWEIYCEWMSVAAPAQSYGYIFGVYEGKNYNSYRLIHKTTSTTEYYVSAKSKAGGGSILLSNVALNAKHSIKIKNGTFTCDGVSYTASTTGTSLPSANTMLLFKSKNNLYSKCRIYSTWAKKDGILKYNMIPSKRKSDNVIGMYDMVSRQFFTNSGNGSFTGA